MTLTVFLAMELVAGRTLARIMAEVFLARRLGAEGFVRTEEPVRDRPGAYAAVGRHLAQSN